MITSPHTCEPIKGSSRSPSASPVVNFLQLALLPRRRPSHAKLPCLLIALTTFAGFSSTASGSTLIVQSFKHDINLTYRDYEGGTGVSASEEAHYAGDGPGPIYTTAITAPLWHGSEPVIQSTVSPFSISFITRELGFEGTTGDVTSEWILSGSGRFRIDIRGAMHVNYTDGAGGESRIGYSFSELDGIILSSGTFSKQTGEWPDISTDYVSLSQSLYLDEDKTYKLVLSSSVQSSDGARNNMRVFLSSVPDNPSTGALLALSLSGICALARAARPRRGVQGDGDAGCGPSGGGK